jgi:hypothetical protein
MTKKHQKILDYIYASIDAIDPTGKNTEKYKEFFDNLSEDEFRNFMKEFLQDEKDHFTVEMDQFDQNVTIEQIKHAADVANVILEDYLVRPDLSDDPENPYVSNEKVLLLYLNQRRVQQTLSVKNHVSTSIDKRNPKVGQVIDDDKNSSTTALEMYQLVFQDAFNKLKEDFGPKSDNLVAKNEMLYQIQRKGSVSLNELPNLPKDKVALNYMNFLFLAAGYQTDLINDKELLPIVIERGGKLYE